MTLGVRSTLSLAIALAQESKKTHTPPIYVVEVKYGGSGVYDKTQSRVEYVVRTSSSVVDPYHKSVVHTVR